MAAASSITSIKFLGLTKGTERIDFSAPGVVFEEQKVREVFSERLGFSRLYTEDDRLLILITNGYGASWSVDPFPVNKKDIDIGRHLLMDARIVGFFYETYITPLMDKPRACKGCGYVCSCSVPEEPMRDFLEGLGFSDVYLGGLQSLQIASIPAKKKFRVIERDGLEQVIIFREDTWEEA
jgi:hypothetical protein